MTEPMQRADSLAEGSPAGDSPAVDSVTVIGAGAMGSQIAMVVALAGLPVTLTDVDPAALGRAVDTLTARMARDVQRGRREAADVDAAFARLRRTPDLAEALAGTDYVIEAAVERIDVKRELFAACDELAPAHAILATNSSSIVSSRLADATGGPQRVCNLHFFNPALVMRCVEVVPGPATHPDTVAASVELVRRLGKEPVVLRREIPGFVANRILGVIRDEALALLDAGVADVADIDLACRTALGHPMGPFELMDLTGVDIGHLVRMDRFEQSGDPADLPHPALGALVRRGELGRKSGVGWYRYDESGAPTPRPRSELLDPPRDSDPPH